MNRTEIKSTDPIVEETGELANWVDQVAEGHTRIVVTRDGEPKAALVSIEDYARLTQEAQSAKPDEKLSWEEWSREISQLREDILAYRGGEPVDLDKLIRDMKDDLEDRDAYNSGS
jgi:prevent-host-death family protein